MPNTPDTPGADAPSVSLKDYEDVSGQTMAAAYEDVSGEPQAVSRDASAEPAEQELETETESESEDDTRPQTEAEKEEFHADAVGFASILLFGGMLMAGFAYFLAQPMHIEHPYNRANFL